MSDLVAVPGIGNGGQDAQVPAVAAVRRVPVSELARGTLILAVGAKAMTWFERTLIDFEDAGIAVTFRKGYTRATRYDLVPAEGKMACGEGDTHEAALRDAQLAWRQLVEDAKAWGAP